MPAPVHVRPLSDTSDASAARRLLREFAASLGDHLDPQELENELAELQLRYAPPDGCLLLAWAGDKPVGCVAMKRADAESCELTRLFVQPAYRGLGAGHSLVGELIVQARRVGYRRMQLVTASFMPAAHRLYTSMGFIRTIPSPTLPPDVWQMGRAL